MRSAVIRMKEAAAIPCIRGESLHERSAALDHSSAPGFDHMLRSLQTPAMARIVPFAVYMFFIAVESLWRDAPFGLLLGLQTVMTAAALLAYRRAYVEFAGFLPGTGPGSGDTARRTAGQILAGVATGVVVYVLWLQLDRPELSLGTGRPLDSARDAWSDAPIHATTRFLCAVVIVPLIEELFWRSFLMRWFQNQHFSDVAPGSVRIGPILASAVLFGLEHHQIVAGVMAGLVYAELYRRTGNLGVVVVAHAITNALLQLL